VFYVLFGVIGLGFRGLYFCFIGFLFAEELKEDKERLQRKVDNLENRLLPPEEGRESIFNRFLNWLSGK